MATVTGLTAERMLAIEGASVVDGDVVGDNLILTQHNGTQINAGSVRGPAGPTGPVGQDLPILVAKPILDVGLAGQIRAGRQLTAADFTNMGLSAPLGLWNLSDLTDASGNGRNLLNKGAVPTGIGINGLANTAAKYVGSAAQSLYISDTGASDALRIKTGSWGIWFKSPKRDAPAMGLISRWGGSGGTSYMLWINGSQKADAYVNTAAGAMSANGTFDVCDDRWHFAVGTYDGSMVRLYIDGILNSMNPITGLILQNGCPLNIGSTDGADAANPAGAPFVGRLDEAFITADVLAEEQIRNLYCAKIPHTLGVAPSRLSLNVHRRRKGGVLSISDFSTQPLRLYNFSAGSLGDEGSNGVVLINEGGVTNGPGVDGTPGNGVAFNGANDLASGETGLPSGLATRSFGAWFKTTAGGAMTVVAWGTTSDADARISMNGILYCTSGQDVISYPMINDGLWHYVVVTEENAPADGIKRKAYVDGRLIGTSNVLTSLVPNAFHIGCCTNNGQRYTGQIDSVFVTDYVMSAEEIYKMYAKGSQTLAPSPKNVGDHVEALTSTDILATFDTLESQHTVDVGVAV